jgi:hypothetical protein
VIKRLLRVTAPGAVFLLALVGAAAAQTTPSQQQQGVPPSSSTSKLGTISKLPKSPPDSYSPQSHPAPTPTPGPGQLLVSGRLRGYQFNRINTPLTGQNNRRAYEFDASPHFDYRIGDTPLSIGYTYSGATGFGLNGPAPIKNNTHVDNTLPGYPLNQEAAELYLQYHDPTAYISIGNQVLNYAWTPNSDSRITPVSYQALDTSFNITSKISISATRIVRWEMRNASTFSDNNLLDAPYAEASQLNYAHGGVNYGAFPGTTPGVLRIAANYHPSARFVLNVENYQFYDMSNLTYVEGRYAIDPYSPANPYIAAQFVNEQNTGGTASGSPVVTAKDQAGIIDNETTGFQIGATVLKGLQVIASSDYMPWKYAYTTNPGAFFGYNAVGTAPVVGKNASGQSIYYVPYGGLASPYTDSLATDPLYTTQITQGMADKRAAGESYKAALIYTIPSKQLRLIASEGWYNYTNQVAIDKQSEFNVDGTYYFNKVRPGPYKGFFVRIRIAPRETPTLPYNFEYQRFQTEYDF